MKRLMGICGSWTLLSVSAVLVSMMLLGAAVVLTAAEVTYEVKDPAVQAADAQRAKLLVEVPASTADYTFPAAAGKPGWEGMAGVRIAKDYFGPGADALDVSPVDFANTKFCYWQLDNIQDGKYYLCLWTQTNDPAHRTEYSPQALLSTLFVNGWPVRFSTTSDPVQVKPNLWIAELQGVTPVELKKGDTVTLGCGDFTNCKFLRLALYKAEPARGHGVTGQSWGIREGNPQQVRVMTRLEILGPGLDGQEHEARVTICNPLHYAAEMNVDWCLADYFGKPLVKKSEPVKVPAHQSLIISHKFTAGGAERTVAVVNGVAIHKFTAAGAERAYQLDVRTHAADPAGALLQRPQEMVELNDFARLAWLPQRPDPLETWNHERRELTEIRTGDRKLLSLDGDSWQIAPLTTRHVPQTVPQDLNYVKTYVPYRNPQKLADGEYGKWFRRTFRLPEWFRGQRYQVFVPKVVVEGTLFVNGKMMGLKREGEALPLVVDITDALKPDGDNELVICARDAIALLKEDCVDQYNRKEEADVDYNSDWVGRTRFFVNLESVTLRTTPEVRVNQVAVVPKVEQNKLKVLCRLENTAKEAREVQLQLAVEQFGKPADVTFPPTPVRLEPGKVQEVTLIGEVKSLVEYTTRQPNLAKLTVNVLQGDKPADQFTQRFGYRQMRIDGLEFKWNGRPKRLLGAFQHWPTHRYEMVEGVEASRDYEPFGQWVSLDLYDEIGMMTYQCLDGYGSLPWKTLNNTHHWDSTRRVAVELAWLTGYHPSILGYDIANESFHYTPYSAGLEGQMKYGELNASVAQAIKDKVDPDFWFFSDGDESLGGRINFCSFHYENQGVNGGSAALPRGFYDLFTGGFHYSPDCFYINGADKPPQLGQVLKANPDWVYGSCPCAETETFWFFGGNNGVWPCAYLGDKVAVSSNHQFWTGRGMAWTKMSLDAYRDMDMAFIGGLYWRNFLATGMQAVSFVLPQQEARYFSDAKFDRRLSIFDDEYQPGKLLFTWQLLDDKGQKVAGNQIAPAPGTKVLHRDRLTFDVPKVDHRTRFTLTMDLTKDGRRRVYEERVVEVWPALETVKLPAPASAVLFDPKGQATEALGQLGCSPKVIATLDEATLAGAKNLIVGPLAFQEGMAAQAETIRKFADRGGRVILLEQTTPLPLPADTYVEPHGKFSTMFVRAKDHPVMQGLADVDFQMWNPGHLLTERVYRRPARGNFMTLVEGGHDGGLYWTPLMEVYVGKGSILATQLSLTAKLTTEPMCAEVLKRMLAYLDQPVYRSATGKLAVIDNASPAVRARLAEVRAEVQAAKAPLPEAPVTLLDLSATPQGPPPGDESATTALKNYVQNGGTLIVHRAGPPHAAWLTALVGRNVKMTVEPYQSWEDREMIDQPASPLLAGINNVDLYWRSHIVSEAPDATEQVSNGVMKHRGAVEYVASVEGVRDLLFPGGLVDVPVGKGRVIIDQLQWEMSEEDIVGGSPKRVISMLLTNLGVAQTPPTPKPVLPAGVTYETLDITALANTSTTDHKIGGNEWCGWGPNSDIRDMPTGKVDFGVPFFIPQGAHNAIVLRTKWVDYLATYPDTVTVPVNRDHVAGIWLLHTGGWSGGKASFGRREICYADGTKEVIDMNETNMGDWNYGRDQFPDEEYTTTMVAWRGSCQQYQITRVYKTLWVNPHPEKKIDKIVITNAGLESDQWRFVPHLAITLAILPQGGAARPAASDAAKAQALIDEATKCLDAKDTKGALDKLDQALAADGANAGVWQVLTGIRAKTDDVPAFTTLCERWMAADPKNYQPYNVLAAFLEQHGQKEQALKLYKKSMEIEWNQPPTGEAIHRLEKELNK